MNKIKKFGAFFLTFSLILSMCAMAANDATVDANGDPYKLGTSETICINGVNTTFYYYYTSDGSRAIDISYDNSLNIDTVINSSANPTYLNKYVVMGGGANTDWELMAGPDDLYVTWAIGTTTAVVAAAIAAGVGALVSNVIAAMGAAALATLAASFTGCTLTVTYYTCRMNWVLQNRFVWSLEVSTGETYGPYSTIQSADRP